jgi:hypothetical protein
MERGCGAATITPQRGRHGEQQRRFFSIPPLSSGRFLQYRIPKNSSQVKSEKTTGCGYSGGPSFAVIEHQPKCKCKRESNEKFRVLKRNRGRGKRALRPMLERSSGQAVSGSGEDRTLLLCDTWRLRGVSRTFAWQKPDRLEHPEAKRLLYSCFATCGVLPSRAGWLQLLGTFDAGVPSAHTLRRRTLCGSPGV